MLSKKARDELIAIYKEEFAKELTDGEAEEIGVRLLRLFSLLRSKSDTNIAEG